MEILPAETPPFLSVRDFRELTGASRGLAYRLVRSGALRAIKLGTRGAIRIPREELRRFLEDRAVWGSER
jgi:excisionase family DNA binding protein